MADLVNGISPEQAAELRTLLVEALLCLQSQMLHGDTELEPGPGERLNAFIDSLTVETPEMSRSAETNRTVQTPPVVSPTPAETPADVSWVETEEIGFGARRKHRSYCGRSASYSCTNNRCDCPCHHGVPERLEETPS